MAAAARPRSRPPGPLAAWRATGADVPFGDPTTDHGVALEGFYLRVADPASGRTAALMVGLTDGEDGRRRALVVLAVHPEGLVRHAVVEGDVVARGSLWAEEAVTVARDAVHARVGDLRLDLALRPGAALRPLLWGGLGPGHLVPWLPQYWTPLDAAVVEAGELGVGGRTSDLRGARVYREKNWGRGFPRHGWWWGVAHAFADPRLVVAFAGGPLSRSGPAPTAVVVATPRSLVRLGSPVLSPVEAVVTDGSWTVRGGGPLHRVRVVGTAAGTAVDLPHPEPGVRSLAWQARQELAGDVSLLLERRAGARWRTAAAGRSGLAGLERGRPAA